MSTASKSIGEKQLPAHPRTI